MERWPRENGPLFLSPATLQSFKSRDELLNHSNKVHQALESAVVVADKKAQMIGDKSRPVDPRAGTKIEQQPT